MFFIYKIFKLNYLYQDLEPYIDTHTIGLHYLKHTMGYLDKLNELLIKNNFNYTYKIKELFFHIEEFPYEDRENILFNLGGFLNHYIYFNSISKNKIGPSEYLLKAIVKKYGTYENLLQEIKTSALKLKGSGYVFLELLPSGEITVINRMNQDNSLFHGNISLICIDMWEHAYYLNYKNNKLQYLDNIYSILDFSRANKIYGNYIKTK